MGAAATARQPDSHPRPWLGLRRRPGRLALVVFRLPLPLYRFGFGWVLGDTFLQLTHAGRRTGTAHETVAMVLAHDRSSGEAVICAVWGPRTDWVRNVRAGKALRVQIGRDSFIPQHRFLTEEEAVVVGTEFRRRHPWRLRLVSRVLGLGDLESDAAIRDFVSSRPFVALRPADSPSQSPGPPAAPGPSRRAVPSGEPADAGGQTRTAHSPRSTR